MHIFYRFYPNLIATNDIIKQKILKKGGRIMKGKKALWILMAILTILAAGCARKSQAEEVFDTYVSHWTKGEFASMYEVLSSSAKKDISKEEFVTKYEKIYQGIGAENISITLHKEDAIEKDNKKMIPCTLKMDTVAGPIELKYKAPFVLEKEEEGERWTLQWDESLIFPQMEQGDSVRVETITAKRGEIYDRKGTPLAINGKIQTIGIVPRNLGEDADTVKERLAQEFQMAVEEIDKKLEASWVKPDLFVPIGALSMEESEQIKELTSLPGILAKKQSARVYPQKQAAAHLVGYIGSITQEELKDLEKKDYHENSLIGKTGLEQIYEEQLRALDGKTIQIVTEDNTIKETLAKKQPKDGEDLHLTIDSDLQKSIFNQMKGEKGTAIAMHPKTGEVLAMVNSPSYDPNDFILGVSNKKWNDLNENQTKPLLNRFAQAYSPGSVFKPITAAIGLETKMIDPNKAMNIAGLKWQKDSSWGNYFVTRVTDPGKPVNLEDALVYSDNIYFARTALEIGEKSFIQGAKKFGIGEKTPFSYPVQKSKLSNDGSLSKGIQLADSGYGQGEISLNPVHLTTMYTSFLNEGDMLQPILLQEKDKEPKKLWKEKTITSETANLIKEDLIQVVERGTGKTAKIEGVPLGGKTGTAELKSSQGEKGQENGWFIAFDGEESRIIVTMMLEDVQGGSSYVIPRVRTVLENYL